MSERKIRVLVAKPGLDGHDRGAKVIARALRDAGMEVIYTGLRQTPEMIAAAALQEDVDAVGISILSGAHKTLCPRIVDLLRENGMDDTLVLVGGIVPSEDIPVQGGRTLHVPKSLKGVAVFSFKRLCGEARGAPDYLAVARRYHSVIIVGIPKLGPENRNEAARFVTLIDALYEHKVKLLASADAPPAELYTAGDGVFEFERTASRLIEMQSEDYLAKGHGADAQAA